MKQLIAPCAVKPGDCVALLSPAWAAPAYFPAIHAQAKQRLEALLNVLVVEYPTTAAMGASLEERARDLNSAFMDPGIRAIMTTVGGDDLIRMTPQLDPDAVRADPKPFFGYSDNTNILHWLWDAGVASFHGGATQVHFGPGPDLDSVHLNSLKAALTGETDHRLEIGTDSEDFGFDWSDPAALTVSSPRGDALPLDFLAFDAPVTGPTWGGCLEVIDQMALAGRLPEADELDGAILMFETSEILPPADLVGRWIRALGERGYLHAAAGLIFARPVVADRDAPVPSHILDARRDAYTEYLLSNIASYRTDLPVCLGLPFGHTKPQVILPHGGEITLDPVTQTVTAHFGR